MDPVFLLLLLLLRERESDYNEPALGERGQEIPDRILSRLIRDFISFRGGVRTGRAFASDEEIVDLVSAVGNDDTATGTTTTTTIRIRTHQRVFREIRGEERRTLRGVWRSESRR